jgi:hypothetical protein
MMTIHALSCKLRIQNLILGDPSSAFQTFCEYARTESHRANKHETVELIALYERAQTCNQTHIM